jgi:uncharacterized phage-associated protein
MPSQDRFWLHNLSQIEQFRASPRHPDHQNAVEAAQAGPCRRSPYGDPKLMPQKKILRRKPVSRLEQIAHTYCERVQQGQHRVDVALILRY